MNQGFDSTDRNPLELFLFAVGFAAFLTGVGGVILTVPAVALFGGMVFLLVLIGYRCTPD